MGLQRSTPYPVDPVLAAGCLRTFQNYMVKAQGGGGQIKTGLFLFWLYTLGSFCVLSHKLAILNHWNKIIY